VWFEPFVRDWIDEIARKVRGEIVVLFDNEDLEASIKVQMKLLFVIVFNIFNITVS